MDTFDDKKRDMFRRPYARRHGEIKAGARVGISAEDLKASLDALGRIEPAFAAARRDAGDPPPRIRDRSYETLLRAIVGQQVSVKAADAIWTRVEAATGGAGDPARVAATSDEDLRAAGLSRQKISYAKSLAEQVLSGRLDFAHLPADDEEAIAALTSAKGIGRWTAEVYLLFAEGRGDIFPAGDLAVQIEIGRIMGLDGRPTEKKIRELAEAWRPYRGAAAIFAWHHRHVIPI
jgi:DNA-3-methyladenine glycosylase II